MLSSSPKKTQNSAFKRVLVRIGKSKIEEMPIFLNLDTYRSNKINHKEIVMIRAPTWAG